MTGRERARTSPFWATDLDRMQSGAREVAEGFHELIQRSPGARQYLWVGSGWREPSGKNDEHGTGRAIDVIVTADTGMMPTPAERAAGNAFVDWLISHADELKIKGIIFSQDSAPRPEFWGYTHPGSWRSGEDRGSISANHVDHVHVFLKEGTAWPASLDSTKISVRPGLPNVGVDNGSGPHLVDSVSVSHLREARYTDPEKDGTPVGPYGDEVFTLETALARTEWLQSQYVDGHYGTSTVGDGSSGYGGTTGFQKKHSGATDPDGRLGQQELTKLFQLAGMSVEVTD